jgi:ABC-2 type transport system permease protein
VAGLLRPYTALFALHFQLGLQYRAAALAGFATQCWWGAIKVMILAAFYSGGGAAHAPMRLEDAITYIWLGQALLALLPWNADSTVAEAVRTGSVGYERLRPTDTYWFWFARAAASLTARAVPRAALMIALAAIALPLMGLGDWSWRPPAGAQAAGLFALSMGAVVLLVSAFRNLVTLTVVVTMTDRGVNVLVASFGMMLSGMIVPLGFFPESWLTALRLQPFASMVDTPYRIYFGDLTGADALAGIGVQLVWTALFVVLGRWWIGAAMSRLQVQGG